MTGLTSIGCDQYISICTDHTATLILLHTDCQLQVLEASADRALLDTDPFAVRNAVASVALRPDLQQLRACLRTYLGRQGGDDEAMPLEGPNIYMVSSAVITSRLPWDDEDEYLETVRANPEFHGKPFRSSTPDLKVEATVALTMQLESVRLLR